MPIPWSLIIPSLITGGGEVAKGLIGARSSGKATEAEVAGLEKSAELQYQATQDELNLLRDIYNLDMELQWPTYRTGRESLGRLAKGMGSGLPPETFRTADKPPQLPAVGRGVRPGMGAGDTSLLSSAIEDAPGPAGSKLKTAVDIGSGFLAGGMTGAAVGGGLLGGTAIGAFGGPIGAAVGLGIGLGKNLIGRGRREANQIVPYQNALMEDAAKVAATIKQKQDSGTITPEDYQQAYTHLNTLKEQFYGLTNDFGRAGSGARQTVGSNLDPMLASWGQLGNIPRRRGGPVYSNRANGGNVRRLSSYAQPYIVGEEGPEPYIRRDGVVRMVGTQGPSLFMPEQDGMILPNPKTARRMMSQPAIPLSSYGRARGGPVSGRDKIHKVMSEFENGTLRSSSGELVTSRDQAIAIAMSEAGMSKPQHRQAGGPVGTGMGAGFQFPEGELPEWAKNLGVSQIGERTFWPGVETPGVAPEGYVPSREVAATMPGGAADVWGDYYGRLDELGAIGKPADTGNVPASASATNNKAIPLSLYGATLPAGSDGAAATPITGSQTFTPPTTTQGIDQNIITQWGWSKNQYGQWVNENGDIGHWTSGGQFINDTQNKIFDPATGKLQDVSATGTQLPASPYPGMEAPYDVYEGEFMQPWQGEFGFDPEAAGFQPFNRPFEFDEADLYKDPGYRFRVAEGKKAIERSAAARGMVQSGRTLKELLRFGQDMATQEYPKAYGRSLGEFGLGYQQTQDAYGRGRSEYDLTRNEFLENQERRFRRLYDFAGLAEEQP